MTVQVIRGDALHLPLADESVDLVCTSPPYFGLRSYQDGGQHYDGQLGSEPTPAEFVDALLQATREMVRCLKPSGSIWINLGDKYSGAQAQNFNGRSRAGDSAKVWQQTDPRRTGIPNKSLMGIPWRYAIACIDQLGLILRAEIIWNKPNGLPESVTDRVRRSHEQWFHLVKQPRYYSAVDEVRETYAPATFSRNQYGRPVNGHPSGDHTGPLRSDRGVMDTNPLGKLPGSVWTIPTEPLTVPPHLGVDHFAAYPSEWPRRIILGWTSPIGICVECGQGRRPVGTAEPFTAKPFAADQQNNGRSWHGGNPATRSLGIAAAERNRVISGYACDCTPFHWEIPDPDRPPVKVYDWHRWTNPPDTRPAVILDPFGGTGTTCLVADVLGRHGIHIDLSHDYNRLARWRIADPASRAKAARVDKPPPVIDGQLSLLDGGAA